MTDEMLLDRSRLVERRALDVIDKTGIIDIWNEVGAEVHIVGSLAMGLMMKHLDIDLHVYSSPLTLRDSFAAMSRLAVHPSITKIECRNLTHTEEQCVEWHAWYESLDNEIWQIDIIHILKGSRYDGYFERMAERIKAVLTDEMRTCILRLKAETPCDEHVMGIEYYQAVIRDGVRTMPEFMRWRERQPATEIIEWIP